MDTSAKYILLSLIPISQNVSNGSSTVSKTRSQRLAERNTEILAKISTGITIQQIQEEYSLTSRQIYNIINIGESELKDWFDSFPRRGMMALFRSNIISVAHEIQKLEEYRDSTDDLNAKAAITNLILNARIKFNRLIAEGPTYMKIKQLLDGRNGKS